MLIRVFWGLLERLVCGVTEWLAACIVGVEKTQGRVGSFDMCTEYWCKIIGEASGDLPFTGGIWGVGSAPDVLMGRGSIL